jgi:hypothetical protein
VGPNELTLTLKAQIFSFERSFDMDHPIVPDEKDLRMEPYSFLSGQMIDISCSNGVGFQTKNLANRD